ncbi:GRB2-associated-binding protein 2-like isoform X3 [Leptotrombidium deliense]|uniref:GRB2-associated-binding protein 2-like isoform X3 n=1 Tax=Leptotrombidium deliense TaxID=299467 RepID=A0A443STL5_9ACAR|nr:GRB2-associated-binding protein 2-like isoform X3 [Leptotrombidium deliense]
MDTGIVLSGYLTKSSSERRIWKANWTERWFVLKQSGQIPGQYVLEYYTDETCRKLKGRIDLDQCEQVDAGLNFGSRKSHPYMFDVKTSKRVYYLVAKTEADMSRWIECICAVCGLKVHYEESVDYRYSPQPSQECVVSASAPSANNTTTSSVNYVAIKTEPKSSINNNSTKSSPKKKYEPSGPYVPIWETNTGKPIFERPPLKENTSRENINIPAAKHAISDEAYDIPRPIAASDNSKSSDNILDKVPPVQKCVNGESAVPPKVNWKTHPNPDSVTLTGDVGRNSVRSCGQGQSPKECLETRRASTPSGLYYNNECIIQSETQQKPPPPRPPKPESLRKTRNNSESCISTHTDASSSSIETRAVSEEKSKEDYSPTTKVPLPNTAKQTPLSPDEMYDIPKPAELQAAVGDILHANVPVLPNSLKRPGRHSYTNAPPGHISTKESIFIYDTKPCLPTACDDAIASIDSEGSDRSPVTPNSALYGNFAALKGMTPPAVNRDLKPRRKSTDSDAAPSPTTSTSGFTLSPPPAVSDAYNKKTFRKHSPNRLLNGTPPRVPSRGRQIVHSREPSASEEDVVRNRKDANDDQVNEVHALVLINHSLIFKARQTVPVPRKAPSECGEIQYLDLSLDTDNHSPTLRHGNGAENHKSSLSLSKDNESSVSALASDTGSTVYKTVDFLKTKAFNELRLNWSESHRSTQ